jgi:hypothetical protein
MIWLTWRQHRTEILMLTGLLALIVVALALTGVPFREIADRLHIATCQTSYAAPACQHGLDVLFTRYAQYNQLRSALPFLNLFPAFLGILIGVPLLAREYEQGTQRLAWTQSMPRLRWLRTKLALLVAGAVGFSLALSAAITWWNVPLRGVYSQYDLPSYDFAGVVMPAFAVLGIALGAGFGALLRRSIPAVALTLLGYVALWQVMDNGLRWWLVPPITRYSAPQDGPSANQQEWIVRSGFADRLGHPIANDAIDRICQHASDGIQCAADHGWRWYAIVQPESHFWQMQGVEAAILLGLALALLGFTLWWTRARAG